MAEQQQQARPTERGGWRHVLATIAAGGISALVLGLLWSATRPAEQAPPALPGAVSTPGSAPPGSAASVAAAPESPATSEQRVAALLAEVDALMRRADSLDARLDSIALPEPALPDPALPEEPAEALPEARVLAATPPGGPLPLAAPEPAAVPPPAPPCAPPRQRRHRRRKARRRSWPWRRRHPHRRRAPPPPPLQPGPPARPSGAAGPSLSGFNWARSLPMPTDASSVAAAARSLGAALCGLLLLAGCGTTPAAPPAPEALPMRVSDAPKPPRTAQPLDEAVLSLTVALLDRARLEPPGPSGRHDLVVDPLIDRATGQQTAVTRGMEQRIGTLVRARYPAFNLRPFGTAALDDQPLILLGAITPVAEAGVIPASEAPFPQVYRIWAVLGDLRTGRIVSHETAWVRGPDVDMTPTAFFRDSPAWNREPLTAAYLRTCAGDPGEAIDPAYLRALRAQAHAADGVRAYEAGNPAAALAAYEAASALPGVTSCACATGSTSPTRRWAATRRPRPPSARWWRRGWTGASWR
ncbi:hypothetical protein [Teichococcus aestuarii]|uniref:hypothetical protein n=1 Tax=Teichococcus aestuarii TaxID=568898 RepID=UPI00362081C8